MTNKNTIPEGILNAIMQQIVNEADNGIKAPIEYNSSEAATYDIGFTTGYQHGAYNWYRRDQETICALQDQIKRLQDNSAEEAYRKTSEWYLKQLRECQEKIKETEGKLKMRWVKISDGLPEFDEFVLWRREDGIYFCRERDKDDFPWWDGDKDADVLFGIRTKCTHWAKIKGPEETD